MSQTRARRRLIFSLVIASSLAVSACTSSQESSDAVGGASGDTASLARYLTGTFSSAEQAALDPENFFDIRLHAVEIWADRDDGPWLYVEQAAASALDRPYRQRVYHLREASPGILASDVYTMPEPLTRAGWWAVPENFDGTLTPGDLTLRDGCTIELRLEIYPNVPVFVGGTVGTGCESNLGDAAYATSEVELFPDRLVTWDRGFTAEGEQAWGATKSGYLFLRVDD